MHRDVIDSLMAGGLLSFLPIWETDSGDRIVIAIGMAALIYIGILFFKEAEEWIKKHLRKNSAAQGRW